MNTKTEWANHYVPPNVTINERALWDRINYLLEQNLKLQEELANVNKGGTEIARLTTQVQAASDSLTQLQTFVGRGQTQFVGGGDAIAGLTGDGTATGPGTVPLTLATVNAAPGSYTNANITVNAKGLVTVASNGSGGSSIDLVLIGVVWGTPGAEVADSIEVAASCTDFSGAPFLSDIVDLRIIVSDGPTDAEPSASATIISAGVPVGTLMAGSGTATVVMRTDAAGAFAIKVQETAVATRYLWINTGGQERLWVRSTVGVLPITFT